MKPDWHFVLADAERINKGATGAHVYTKDEYGRAMLDLARAEAGLCESTAAALSRLWAGNDPRIAALHRAADAAPLLRKSGSRAGVARVMDDYAATKRRQGESHEHAFDRLLASDAFMKNMYLAYEEAAP